MSTETNTSHFSRAKILHYLKQKLRQKGGVRKAIMVTAFYVFGIYALLFATEETMRDTYGRSIGHLKGMLFFCLALLFACGVRDYLRFYKSDDN